MSKAKDNFENMMEEKYYLPNELIIASKYVEELKKKIKIQEKEKEQIRMCNKDLKENLKKLEEEKRTLLEYIKRIYNEEINYNELKAIYFKYKLS